MWRWLEPDHSVSEVCLYSQGEKLARVHPGAVSYSEGPAAGRGGAALQKPKDTSSQTGMGTRWPESRDVSAAAVSALSSLSSLRIKWTRRVCRNLLAAP